MYCMEQTAKKFKTEKLIRSKVTVNSLGNPCSQSWRKEKATVGKNKEQHTKRYQIQPCWNTHTHPFNGPLSGSTRVSPYQKGKPIWIFAEAIEWLAVASAGPYASLHLAPVRKPRQYPTTQCLQAGCPSCRPTNSVKALKSLGTGVLTKYHI